MKKHRKTVLIITAAALAAVFITFFTVRSSRRQNYEYIDLPIVLGNESEVVDVIRESMTQRKEKILIQFTAKKDYSRDVIFALAGALIQKAFEPTGSPVQGDYIRFQYGGYKVTFTDPQNETGTYDYSVRIMPTYYTNTVKEEAVDEAVEEFLSSAGFTRRTSDYEKVKAVHDYLENICDYDWRNSQLSHRHIKSTAYAALINGEASCQGYSVAMYRLLMESGVQCRIITGYATSPETGETEYHAWNLVRVDGKWYNLDVTWDDETGTSDYFLKSDATLSTHEREDRYDAEDFRSEYPVSDTDWQS